MSGSMGSHEAKIGPILSVQEVRSDACTKLASSILLGRIIALKNSLKAMRPVGLDSEGRFAWAFFLSLKPIDALQSHFESFTIAV
jgi:hypothetical protein